MDFFFSANVHRCNIAFSVVHVQVCFKSYLSIILFGGHQDAANSISTVMLPVGLYVLENNNCTSNTNSYV